MKDDYLNYICDNIESTNIITTPWDHIHLKKFLPNDLFNTINNEITEYYISEVRENKRISKRIYNYEYRPMIGETPDVKILAPGLKQYYNILNSVEIKNILTEKFNITKKYKYGLNELFGDCDIITPGYEWPIHTDISRKLITIVHYFAEDNDDTEIGTRVYPPTEQIDDLDYEKDCVQVIPYIKNSAIIFSPCKEVGKCTNHAYRHKSTTTKYRKALQTFFVKRTKGKNYTL